MGPRSKVQISTISANERGKRQIAQDTDSSFGCSHERVSARNVRLDDSETAYSPCFFFSLHNHSLGEWCDRDALPCSSLSCRVSVVPLATDSTDTSEKQSASLREVPPWGKNQLRLRASTVRVCPCFGCSNRSIVPGRKAERSAAHGASFPPVVRALRQSVLQGDFPGQGHWPNRESVLAVEHPEALAIRFPSTTAVHIVRSLSWTEWWVFKWLWFYCGFGIRM